MEKIIIKGDPDLAELIPSYLENRKGDCTAIEKALDEGDYETVRILSHSMKGSGGGYGFEEISRLGAEMEKAAKEEDPDTVKAGIKELLAYLDRVEVVF